MSKVPLSYIITDYKSAETFCLSYRMPFAEFTELQKSVLENVFFWNQSQNLIVKGEPGSGKTLLAELAFLSIDKPQNCKNRKLLYLLPYRALLNEKYEYFSNKYDRSQVRIYRSSSDFSDNDDNIFNANCEIAIMIYDKLDNYLCSCESGNDIFYEYDLIVMDEFSLIANIERGIRINNILRAYNSVSSIKNIREKARIIALTVPECVTSEYDLLGFKSLVSDARPLKLNEAIIQADCAKIFPKDSKDTWPVKFDILDVANNDYQESLEDLINLHPRDILYSVIKSHRKLNHNIIVFCNSRESSRNICRSISKIVRGNSLAHGDWSEHLLSIKKKMGDNCYGSIDENLLISSRNGVVFHNADLPDEIRREIESEFAKKNSRINIIVSTETLAYGINCSAEVVIIYDRIKPTTIDDFPVFTVGTSSSDLYMRYLNSVEYKNYVGRAGRLGYSDDKSQHVGYAYLITKGHTGTRKVRSLYYSTDGKRFRSCKRLFAMKLRWRTITTTSMIFDEVNISSNGTLEIESIKSAIEFLCGTKKIRFEDEFAQRILDEMEKLQLVELDADLSVDKKIYSTTALGDAIHGCHIPYEALKGLGNIAFHLKNNKFSDFLLIFQICGIMQNTNLCTINRHKENLKKFINDTVNFLSDLKDTKQIDIKIYNYFTKKVDSMQKIIFDSQVNEFGVCNLGEELAKNIHQFVNASILHLWHNGISIETINKKYGFQVCLGAIKNISRNIIHIFECLIKYLAAFVKHEELIQKVNEVKYAVKYGIPFDCIMALDYHVSTEIRPEICGILSRYSLTDCVDILSKISPSTYINDSSSLMDSKNFRKKLQAYAKELLQ